MEFTRGNLERAIAFVALHHDVVAAVAVRRQAPRLEAARGVVEHVSSIVEHKPCALTPQSKAELDVFGALKGRIEATRAQEAVARERRIAGVELTLRARPQPGQHGAVLRLKHLLLPAHPHGPWPRAWGRHRPDDDSVGFSGVRGDVLAQQLGYRQDVIIEKHDERPTRS